MALSQLLPGALAAGLGQQGAGFQSKMQLREGGWSLLPARSGAGVRLFGSPVKPHVPKEPLAHSRAGPKPTILSSFRKLGAVAGQVTRVTAKGSPGWRCHSPGQAVLCGCSRRLQAPSSGLWGFLGSWPCSQPCSWVNFPRCLQGIQFPSRLSRSPRQRGNHSIASRKRNGGRSFSGLFPVLFL